MPFNSWDGLSFLGEYSRDSCVLFFLTASLILMFKKKINLPIINMPKEVFIYTKKKCKKNSQIGLLATEGTLTTGVYNKFFDKNFFFFLWER